MIHFLLLLLLLLLLLFLLQVYPLQLVPNYIMIRALAHQVGRVIPSRLYLFSLFPLPIHLLFLFLFLLLLLLLTSGRPNPGRLPEHGGPEPDPLPRPLPPGDLLPSLVSPLLPRPTRGGDTRAPGWSGSRGGGRGARRPGPRGNCHLGGGRRWTPAFATYPMSFSVPPPNLAQVERAVKGAVKGGERVAPHATLSRQVAALTGNNR